MQDKDIMTYLFERIQDISNFRHSDEELKNCSKVTNKTDDDLNNFITQKIPPCLKRPLERLIEKKEGAYYDYFDRENLLYYRSGFSDAISLILSNVIPNNDDCSI